MNRKDSIYIFYKKNKDKFRIDEKGNVIVSIGELNHHQLNQFMLSLYDFQKEPEFYDLVKDGAVNDNFLNKLKRCLKNIFL